DTTRAGSDGPSEIARPPARGRSNVDHPRHRNPDDVRHASAALDGGRRRGVHTAHACDRGRGRHAVVEAVDALLLPLLDAFERVEWVQRHLYPPAAEQLVDVIAPGADAIEAPLAALEALDRSSAPAFLRDRLLEVARETVALARQFSDAARSAEDFVGLYRALRRFARVQESLYPLAPVLDPVSRWFLEPARRADDELVARLAAAALRRDEVRAGVLHARNERGARGGFSLYVPETWDGRAAMPL